MAMQKRLSNGSWIDIDEEREDYFIALVLERDPWYAPRVNRAPMTTPDEVRQYLATGKTISYDSDWYAKIRDGKAAKSAALKRKLTQTPVAEKLCDCGHTSAHPMNTARGTACPACYDEMSE